MYFARSPIINTVNPRWHSQPIRFKQIDDFHKIYYCRYYSIFNVVFVSTFFSRFTGNYLLYVIHNQDWTSNNLIKYKISIHLRWIRDFYCFFRLLFVSCYLLFVVNFFFYISNRQSVIWWKLNAIWISKRQRWKRNANHFSRTVILFVKLIVEKKIFLLILDKPMKHTQIRLFFVVLS